MPESTVLDVAFALRYDDGVVGEAQPGRVGVQVDSAVALVTLHSAHVLEADGHGREVVILPDAYEYAAAPLFVITVGHYNPGDRVELFDAFTWQLASAAPLPPTNGALITAPEDPAPVPPPSPFTHPSAEVRIPALLTEYLAGGDQSLVDNADPDDLRHALLQVREVVAAADRVVAAASGRMDWRDPLGPSSVLRCWTPTWTPADATGEDPDAFARCEDCVPCFTALAVDVYRQIRSSLAYDPETDWSLVAVKRLRDAVAAVDAEIDLLDPVPPRGTPQERVRWYLDHHVHRPLGWWNPNVASPQAAIRVGGPRPGPAWQAVYVASPADPSEEPTSD